MAHENVLGALLVARRAPVECVPAPAGAESDHGGAVEASVEGGLQVVQLGGPHAEVAHTDRVGRLPTPKQGMPLPMTRGR